MAVLLSPSILLTKANGTVRCIESSRGIVEQRCSASGGIVVGRIAKEAPSAKRSVKAGFAVAFQREKSNRRVESAGGETKKSTLPFRRIAAGVAAVRCRNDCLRHWAKRKVVKCKTNEKCRSGNPPMSSFELS